MMDLREIIKWFIPCFHILLAILQNKNTRLTFVCLFLLFNSCPGYAAVVSDSVIQVQTKNIGSFNESYINVNQSDIISVKNKEFLRPKDVSEGRTFGRPMKKMMAALIPLVFQLGAASTWAVIAAIVGVKTLAVTLFILKILLLAGAVKIGALFGHKGHHSHGWETPHQSHAWEPPHHSHGWEPQPQKEIHLHIHNGQQGGSHEEHTAYTGWSRNGVPGPAANVADSKNINVVIEPSVGPQTISTPYGNYVKVQSALAAPIVVKRK